VTGDTATPAIRRARADDAEALARVYVDAWRVTYAGLVPDRVLTGMSYARQTAQWRHLIAASAAGRRRAEAVLVAEDGQGGVAGMASCGRAREPAFGHQGEVYTLYVQQDHQGGGIGRGLLRAAFDALAEQGCGSALIWVLAGNPSRFFYAAMGGRLVALRREPLWGTALDEEGYGWDDLAKVPGRAGAGPASP